MKTGFTSVSIGIFSWTLYEPEEGRFELEWMDRLHQEHTWHF